MKHGLKVLGALGALSVMGTANAAAMTLPAELTDALGSVAVIGAGVFAIIVGIKVYKWVRRAL
jgi:Inovirus Coat protein B